MVVIVWRWTLNVEGLNKHERTTAMMARNQILDTHQMSFINELTEMQASMQFVGHKWRRDETSSSVELEGQTCETIRYGKMGKCVLKVDTEHVKCINDK